MSLGPGPQYHPDTLVFWNLLGSFAQVEQSAAGPNCTEAPASPGYVNGYDWPNFGGAINPNANNEGIYSYNIGNIFLANAGAIEFFVYPDGYTVANGSTSTAGVKWMWFIRENTGANLMRIGWVNTGFYWNIRSGGVWQGIFGLGVRNPVIMDSNNQEWHHLGCAWDTTGIGGGGNTREVYWDNVLADADNGALAMPLLCDVSPDWIATIGNGAPSWGLNAPFNGRMDNIKIWNYAKVDFSDSIAAEGFTAPAPAAGPRAPELFDIKRPRVEIMGQDLACRIQTTPKIIEKRSIGSDLVFPADCKIVCENFDNSFSLEHPSSLFSGTNWQNESVEIWDREGIKVWDGVLAEPQVDHARRMTTIVSRSRLHEWRDITVTYTSAVAETPASALQNVAAAIGFPHLDTASVTASDAQQTADGISISVTLTSADNATFGQVLNKLADYGCADVYEHLGQLRYVYYTGAAARPSVTLQECDYVSTPKLTRSTRNLINDYAIWEVSGGGATRTDTTEGDIGAASRLQMGTFLLKSVPGTLETQYQLQDQTSAVAVGEAYIRRTHIDLAVSPRPRIEVQFDLELHHRVWVDLLSDFAMTYEREGWTAKTFRVVAFERDDTRKRITITAQEWPQ